MLRKEGHFVKMPTQEFMLGLPEIGFRCIRLVRTTEPGRGAGEAGSRAGEQGSREPGRGAREQGRGSRGGSGITNGVPSNLVMAPEHLQRLSLALRHPQDRESVAEVGLLPVQRWFAPAEPSNALVRQFRFRHRVGDPASGHECR
jgi:hypothetical protein